MSVLDIGIIVVLAVSTFVGLRIGVIKTVLSLAGVIVGVVLAGQYHAELANILPFFSDNPEVANIVAFVIILIVVMIIAAVAAFFLKWAVSAIMLGWVNRLGGAFLGLLLGAIFCAALLATWVKWMGAQDTITNSLLAPILLDKFPMILVLLPSEFDAVREFFQ